MQAFFTRILYPGLVSDQISAKGTHLRRLRQNAGLSMRELARQIDQDHSNLRYWEQTGNLPRSNVLIPMAKALGVSVEELLGQPKPRRQTTPAGRMRLLFEAASKLSRTKQEKIIAILEPFVRENLKT